MGLWEDLQAKSPQTGLDLVKSSLNKIAPMATTFTQQNNIGQAQSLIQPKSASAGTGTIPEQFVNFMGNVAGQIGNMAGSLIQGAYKSTIENPVNFVTNNVPKMFDINNKIDINTKQQQELDNNFNTLIKNYQSGGISKEEYTKSLLDISNQQQDLAKQANTNLSDWNQNNSTISQNAMDTALDAAAIIFALPTGGLSLDGLVAKGVAEAGAKIGIDATAGAIIDGSIPKLVKFFGQEITNPTFLSASSKIEGITTDIINSANKILSWNGKFPEATIGKIAAETAANAEIGATASQIAKKAAINLLLQKPLIYQTNVDIVSGIYNNMVKGDLGGAAGDLALTGAMALSGGPLGLALDKIGQSFQYLKARATVANAKVLTEDLFNSESLKHASGESMLDFLSAGVGNGELSAGFKALETRLAKNNEGKLDYLAYKAMEETNLNLTNGNAAKAAENILKHYTARGEDWLKTHTIDDILNDMVKNQEAIELAKEAGKRLGLSADELSRIVVGRVDSATIKGIQDVISKVDESFGTITNEMKMNSTEFAAIRDARQKAIQDYIAKGRAEAFANNGNFIDNLTNIYMNNVATEDAIKAIGKIVKTTEYSGLPKAVSEEIKKMGYIVTMPEKTFTKYTLRSEVTGGIKTAFANTAQNIEGSAFEQAVKPLPVLQGITNLLTNIGLSPIAAQEKVQAMFRENFAQSIKASEIKILSTEGKSFTPERILSKIDNFIADNNAQSGLHFMYTDRRQLNISDIKKTFKVGETEAKKIMSSINQAYLDIPLKVRGLGDYVLDRNLAYNPLAAKYGKFQGTARYSYNPFFKLQQAVQTEAATQLESGGKILQLPGLSKVNKILFGSKTQEIATVRSELESRGIFPAGFSGAGAEDLRGKVGSNITSSEKNSIAGMVEQLARKNNQDIKTFVANNEDRIIDIARTVTQNDFKGDWLDSPMARTINTAFYPFRFNMKIAGQMAKYVSKMPATTQVAIISNVIDATNWLKSDEGVAWTSNNSDTVKLFQWINPLAPLNYVAQLGKDITDPSNASIGDFGLMGGLPFGVITQFMESAGITNISAPYMDPKTGDVLPKYIPKSTVAQINLAVQDFIGSLFSYPGQIAGLPGKAKIIRDVTNQFIPGGAYGDTTPVDQSERMTPEQIRQQKIIKNISGVSTQNPATTPTPTPITSTTIKSTPIKTPAPIYKASSSSAQKKKKSDFKPRPING